MDELIPILAALLGAGVTAAATTIWTTVREWSRNKGQKERAQGDLTYAELQEILQQLQKVRNEMEDIEGRISDDLSEPTKRDTPIHHVSGS